MRVVVGVLLALEELAAFLQHDDDVHVQTLVFLGLGGVVSVLHELAGEGTISLHIHTVFDKIRVEVFDGEELARAVHHGLGFAVLVDHLQGRNASSQSHALVVGTESRGDVDDTRTVFGRDIVARDDAERAFAWIDPRDKLLILNANQFATFELLDDFGGFLEHGLDQGFGHDDLARLLGVGMHGFKQHIIDVLPNAEGGVAR